MGSEHYCLRWNNHQANLLGVCAQLLRDERLVDVTLACADEGRCIRAHKVVLSACSAYFRALFVDHPARHPIVILKDVRFSDLRTIVEFMYKGEVRVEYAQLNRLLQTAESLKPPTPMDLDDAASPGGVVLCKFCGKSFPDVAALIAHLPAHTGDRPFKCEFCGKAFKLRHHMKDHCRVHTGERPFRCSLCGKTFSRSTILKAHEKTHYPKYVRKFLSPSPLDTEEENPH
ncbi:hypothetical protein YQE_03144, partial [Dendroctonus ponderosae]